MQRCSSFFMSLAIKNSMKNSEVISVEKVKEIFDHNFKFRSQIIRFQNDTDDIIKFLNLDGRNFELKKYINFPLRFVLVDGDSSIDFYMDVFYNLLEEDSYVIFDDCTPSINRFTIQNCFIDKKTHSKFNKENTRSFNFTVGKEPLSKNYTIYKLVNYFISKGYFIIEERINNILICKKTSNCIFDLNSHLEDVINIRNDIYGEYLNFNEKTFDFCNLYPLKNKEDLLKLLGIINYDK